MWRATYILTLHIVYTCYISCLCRPPPAIFIAILIFNNPIFNASIMGGEHVVPPLLDLCDVAQGTGARFCPV